MRNTLIPFFLVLYYIHKDTKNSRVYVFLYVITVLMLPAYTLLVLAGYNPISWFIQPTWRDPYSAIEYLIYLCLALLFSFKRTLNHSYSYTVSVVSCGVVGYLYEVPRWYALGFFELFRTAKTSFIILDWGMLSLPVYAYFLYLYKPRLTKLVLVSGLNYLLYLFIHLYYYTELRLFLYSLPGPFSKMVYMRLPAMLLTLSLISSVKGKN